MSQMVDLQDDEVDNGDVYETLLRVRGLNGRLVGATVFSGIALMAAVAFAVFAYFGRADAPVKAVDQAGRATELQGIASMDAHPGRQAPAQVQK